MGRLVCARTGTKAGRKLALECRVGDSRQPGLGFQQTHPGNWGAVSLAGPWPPGGSSSGVQTPGQCTETINCPMDASFSCHMSIFITSFLRVKSKKGAEPPQVSDV